MKADALRGHLDALILATVEGQPRHGYAIIEALAARSGGELDLPTGTVYPALRRLEAAGYLRSDWSDDSGRRRRTYTLSRSGHKRLAAAREEWKQFSRVVGDVLKPA
ncbi:PadR family transcriptional regulator [Paractinoplanes abujensis]|uniref:DNA-binding PadR family transcriptional regulator n=1 Tax=Paractinoplanes abujensis TaxID=882441 RepID=A0A7W7FYQ8_9ACTN|nr:helix-turn-helix transcriptional regulator [Actinoplanes abujensis]MBB4691283.1 DNA-binding PadR family transcriptional regulator [Actinoplanes abujensis]GID17302.1 PadR family transcriptional regulator [Actinoplanes abujensis]